MDKGEHAVFGFSSAGFFTLHMLLTQPGMFCRHIAASCTWLGAGEYFLECAQRYAERAASPLTDLYLAVGSRHEEQLPCFHQLIEFLSNKKLSNLRLNSRGFEGAGHTAGVIGKTILDRLRAVFQD